MDPFLDVPIFSSVLNASPDVEEEIRILLAEAYNNNLFLNLSDDCDYLLSFYSKDICNKYLNNNRAYDLFLNKLQPPDVENLHLNESFRNSVFTLRSEILFSHGIFLYNMRASTGKSNTYEQSILDKETREKISQYKETFRFIRYYELAPDDFFGQLKTLPYKKIEKYAAGISKFKEITLHPSFQRMITSYIFFSSDNPLFLFFINYLKEESITKQLEDYLLSLIPKLPYLINRDKNNKDTPYWQFRMHSEHIMFRLLMKRRRKDCLEAIEKQLLQGKIDYEARTLFFSILACYDLFTLPTLKLFAQEKSNSCRRGVFDQMHHAYIYKFEDLCFRAIDESDRDTAHNLFSKFLSKANSDSIEGYLYFTCPNSKLLLFLGVNKYCDSVIQRRLEESEQTVEIERHNAKNHYLKITNWLNPDIPIVAENKNYEILMFAGK